MTKFGLKSIALLMTLLMYGCSTFPNNIGSPMISLKPKVAPSSQSSQGSQSSQSSQDGQKGVYVVDKKEILYGSNSTTATTILPVETSIGGLKSQIMAFRAAYQLRQNELFREIDISNNVQLIGILAAAAGVAKSNLDLQKGGATVAGLSTFYSSHFQIAVQANNYKVAASAMECIYRKVDALPDTFFEEIYPEGNFIIRRTDVLDADPTKSSDAYNILSHLFVSLNDTVYKADQKLRSLQSSLSIATAQVADIQSAIDSAVESKAVSADAPKNFNSVLEGNMTSLKNALEKRRPDGKKSVNTTSDIAKLQEGQGDESEQLKRMGKIQEILTDTQHLSQLLELPASVELCVTALGGQ